ncbi:MAG: hypothetical protein ACLUNX_04420 [Angelakisella sp.]
MKKLFAFLLVVVMILSMMVGCGNNTTPAMTGYQEDRNPQGRFRSFP